MNANPAITRFDSYLHELASNYASLPDKPDENAQLTIGALWHCAAGQPKSAAAVEDAPLPPLDAAGEARMAALIARRVAGEPLAYITGLQRFMGLELLASPAAMIPRRETELLGAAAIACARQLAAPTTTVLDICAGSGNLSCAIASQVPGAHIHAADISADAVALARRNIERCGFQDRIEAQAGDFLKPFETPQFLGKVDLIVCNPPYISAQKRQSMATEIARYEPSQAFDGGPLGINLLNRLIREAPLFLRSGGMLAFELGLGQGRAVCQRVNRSELLELISTAEDDGGHIRAVVARRR